jgi:hypothetical protein
MHGIFIPMVERERSMPMPRPAVNPKGIDLIASGRVRSRAPSTLQTDAEVNSSSRSVKAGGKE